MDNNNLKHELIYKGSCRVKEYKDELNNINVFPVPDGDTGSNLFSLFNGIIKFYNLGEKNEEELKEVILYYSKGNSGAIFSQFLITFISRFQDDTVFNFIDSINSAYYDTYKSVSEPKEGTILTVMREWVNEINGLVSSKSEFNIKELIKLSIDKLQLSVENTRNQMEILKKYGVVDAGAYAFLLFVEGMATSDHVSIELNKNNKQIISMNSEKHVLEISNQSTERYCMELVLKDIKNEEMIKERLSEIGSSFSFVGSNGIGKVHIHVNNPEELIVVAKEYAQVIRQKVDDMQRQYEITYKRKGKIALVIDSACDIPKDFLDQYQIHLLPLNLELDGCNYLDKLTITPETFYQLYEDTNSKATTSQPSVKQVEDLYTTLIDKYDHIISLHLSKELSGTYNLCKSVANKINSKKINVINSKTLSGSYGLLVVKAAQLISSGRNINQLIEQIEELIKKTEILVSVKTLEYMVRGGRVRPIIGKIGNIFRVKPIVSLDKQGRSTLYGSTIFRQSNINKLINQVRKIHNKYGINQYVLMHADNENDARYIEKKLKKFIDIEPLYYSNVAPTIGIHAGRGAVSIAMLLNTVNTREVK